MRPAHVLLCAALVVIIYGSLFPFDFQDQPASLADLFSHWNPFLDRADAVDNVLLFVPLGLALYFSFGRPAARLAASALAWLALGLGLQWVQFFLPGRVASLADAINNAIGLSLGLWLAQRVAPWLEGRRVAGSNGDAFALLLALLWYAYESFPFVPTLDVGLLRQHLKGVLAPEPFEAWRLVRHALAAILGTMLLLRARPLQSRRATVAIAAALVLLGELLVPYGELRIETLAGIVAGLVVGESLDRYYSPRSHTIVMAVALVAFASTVITPFRGQSPDAGFTITPFSGLLWFGNTSGIAPAAFEALAIGALLWSGLQAGAQAKALSRHGSWLVLALLMLAELARVHVLGLRGDTTTLVLWLLLAPLAHLTGRPVATTVHEISRATPRHDGRSHLRQGTVATPAGEQALERIRLMVLVQAASGLTVLTLALWLALRLPSIPYNVKELFEAPGMLPIALFSAALLWLGWGPWWVAATAARLRAGELWLPVLLFAAAMVSLLLLRLSVTQESLDDVVGSPDLYRQITVDGLWGAPWSARLSTWPAAPVQALEQALRFAALYGLLLVPLTVAAIRLCGRWSARRQLLGIAASAGTWWLAKLVVVDWAATDNLTELIARDGMPYLSLVLALLALNVAVIVAQPGVRALLAAAISAPLFVPATWWLLLQGLEPVLVKYGQVFSALQFLLGQNRSQQLTEWQLFLRWSVLYMAAIAILAWGMRLARAWSRASAQSGTVN